MAGNNPPPKPWEKAGSTSGPSPFKPAAPGKTSEVVEASGTAKPAEPVPPPIRNTVATRTVPTRPWDHQTTTYGGGFRSNYGASNYGTGYGGYGGGYNNRLYGNNMYSNRGGFGGGLYGASSGEPDPKNPFGDGASPPGFWISLMRVMEGVVTFFGRIAMLIDQNTQAFHMFMTGLLQIFDRSGLLYIEIAGFVLRLLGRRRKTQNVGPDGQTSVEGPKASAPVVGPKGAAPSAAWDNVWGGDNASK